MPQSVTNLLEDTRTVDVKDAPKPFDSSAQADVILRSSDSIDLFASKFLLCLVSPIFKDMFSLNQGEALEKNETKNKLPVVPLEEDSETVYNLLLLIYPYAQQPTSKTDILVKTAEAAQKYCMNEIEEELRRLFLTSQVMVEEPLRAFCVGMHFGWQDVVKVAAFNTLSKQQQDLRECDELDLVRGRDYYKLLQWRFKCADAVDELFGNAKSLPSMISKWLVGGEARKMWKESGCPRGTAGLKKSLLEGMDRNLKLSGMTVLRVEACDELMEVIDREISKVPFDIVVEKVI
ncbi:hypothetical protein AX17_004154 [Amanita inopinata Kibby_2008]|nr:hypothetical protein AX17_004154 [Amanita inopinata Kibby_2008]